MNLELTNRQAQEREDQPECHQPQGRVDSPRVSELCQERQKEQPARTLQRPQGSEQRSYDKCGQHVRHTHVLEFQEDDPQAEQQHAPRRSHR